MARIKKNSKAINIRLDAELVDKLWNTANERGQTLTVCLERIIKEYFDKNSSAQDKDKTL